MAGAEEDFAVLRVPEQDVPSGQCLRSSPGSREGCRETALGTDRGDALPTEQESVCKDFTLC